MSPHDRKSPYYEVLRDVLDQYFWFFKATMHENPTDVPEHRHEILFLHYSRLYSSQMKTIYIDHGADEDEVAERALWEVIDCYAHERKEARDYYAELRQLLRDNYIDSVDIVKEDTGYTTGARYKLSVELKKDSEEYRKYGHWVIAETYGRDYQQAAYLALSIMDFKKSNSLLWVNEAYNLPKRLAHMPWTGEDRDRGINYFSESDKKALRKDMENNKVVIPNILRSGEKVEPVVGKSESMKSMKGLWKNYSPFSSPKEEKKSFISNADSSGSSANVSKHSNSGLSLFRSRRGSRDATHSQNASRVPSPSGTRDSKHKTSHPSSKASSRTAKEDKGDGLVMKEPPSKSKDPGSRPTSQQTQRGSHGTHTRHGNPIIEE